MENNLLFCWLGMTDLNAAEGIQGIGLGPIAQAVSQKSYKEVLLLNNWEQAKAKKYTSWLYKKTSSKITLKQISLSSPTNFGEIYNAASKAILEKEREYGSDINFIFHLSPGTPAMAAVWILIAKTHFPALLIESSKEHGVNNVSVPFDISAEFIPELLRKSDKTFKKLAAALPIESPEFNDIYHRSEVMQRAVLRARCVAPRSIPVLIEGESGTGKELFARAIHGSSPRKDKPFISVNCGAIPKELFESEFFGHEKGAFTGAVAAHKGYFEEAHQGTIFLDEIGELPKKMQVKLLRTVQENEVKRIGAKKVKEVEIRIIAATNRSLIEKVADGSFREDLFYRLAVAVVNLPSLRDRTGDIGLLIDRFMEHINKDNYNELNQKHKKISVTAKNLLFQYPWPGNVRELQNTLTRASIWSVDEEIGEADIREALFPIPANNKAHDQILNQSLKNGFNLPEVIKKVATHYLERGLEKNNGNKTKAAKTLGLSSYQTLTNWLKKYNLE